MGRRGGQGNYPEEAMRKKPMGVDTGDKMNGAGKRRMEMMGHYYAEKMKEAETERPGRNSCPVGGT